MSKYVYDVNATIRGKRRRIDTFGLKENAVAKVNSLKKEHPKSNPTIKKIVFKDYKAHIKKR